MLMYNHHHHHPHHHHTNQNNDHNGHRINNQGNHHHNHHRNNTPLVNTTTSSRLSSPVAVLPSASSISMYSSRYIQSITNSPAVHKFIAGSIAAITAVTMCYPLDLIRTRLSTELDTIPPPSSSSTTTTTTMNDMKN